MGREGRDEFNEDIAPLKSDEYTMGLSCLLQARETSNKVNYIPPKWANKYTKDSFPMRLNFDTPQSWANDNYWWMELGGVYNSIEDTENLRDELLKVAFGVWDFIKNSGCCDAENWDVEWVGFLPGKRESRRYVGDYILTQNDVRAEGRFDDLVAYGGWSMDDHHPEGFETKEAPTIFHPAPSPYGIPYRCLYSKNIKNLMFAGRNISTTHSAMSSYRVMATCGMIGQAMGTAAAIAISKGLLPHDIYLKNINVLKKALLDDDCYLPWNKREIPFLTKDAVITANQGDVSMLLNGIERPVDGQENAWEAPIGTQIQLDFKNVKHIKTARIVFDSDLNRKSWGGNIKWYLRDFPMRCNIFLGDKSVDVPKTLVRQFIIEVDVGDGIWHTVYAEDNNYQRLVRIPINCLAQRIRLTPQETWGNHTVRLFAFDVE